MTSKIRFRELAPGETLDSYEIEKSQILSVNDASYENDGMTQRLCRVWYIEEVGE